MKIYHSITQLHTQSAVALGYFDGLHIGHRAVIKAAVSCASQKQLASALFTFTLPANQNIKGREILSADEKQLRASDLGMEHYIAPEFGEVRGLSCEQFVSDILIAQLHASAVFCGEDYTFGANKSGNVASLRAICEARGVSVTVVPMQQYKGEGVSSTRIRDALANGNLADVTAMLQQPYAICMDVVHGRKLGRTIGVPTINQIYPASMQLPKSGVYATSVTIDGRLYAGATGIGSRPTVSGEGISCETYICDYEGDLYGQCLRVEFLQFLRNTEKFASLDALRDCILSAAEQSKQINNLPL